MNYGVNKMTDQKFLKEIIKRGSKSDDGYFTYAHLTAVLLSKKYHDSLFQLHNGPVWDGDVSSKSERDYLISIGLATRVCVGGQQGYTGTVYFAHTVIKAIKDIKAGNIAA